MSILTIIIFLPILGAVAILLGAPARRTSLAVGVFDLALVLAVMIGFKPGAGFQQVASWPVVPSLDLNFTVGADGLSLLLLLLTSIVTLAAVWIARTPDRHAGLFYICLLLISGGAFGAFASILLIGAISLPIFVSIYLSSSSSVQSSNKGLPTTSTEPSSNSNRSTSNSNNNSSTHGEPGANPPHYLGSPDMKVVVEVFGDFQCPRCGVLYGDMKKVEKDYGNKITIVYRQYPLAQIHQFAYDAACASEAAGMQGKFWEMHDMLYEKQKDWSSATDARSEFFKYAQQLGLNVTRFQSDMTSAMVNSRIALDVRRGESMGVSGTPTIYVNGKMVSVSDMDAEHLHRYIDAALGQTKD